MNPLCYTHDFLRKNREIRPKNWSSEDESNRPNQPNQPTCILTYPTIMQQIKIAKQRCFIFSF